MTLICRFFFKSVGIKCCHQCCRCRLNVDVILSIHTTESLATNLQTKLEEIIQFSLTLQKQKKVIGERPGWDKHQKEMDGIFGCGWFGSSVICLLSALDECFPKYCYCHCIGSPQGGRSSLGKAAPSLLKLSLKSKCLVLSLPTAPN